MVYESDFYTTRRPYTRPSSYSVTTPRHYVVTDVPDRRRAEEQYSYSYSSTSSTSDGSRYPKTSSYSSTTERRTGSGPGGYDYTTERTSTSGDGPRGYSYSSTTSGRLPYGTNYRHYSYRTLPLRYIPLPSIGKVHAVTSFYPVSVPYTGHRRLVMSGTPPHSVVTIRVRPSVVIRELDRIEHKFRPSHSYSATEDFLRSNAMKDWEDESRKIRADTASLMHRVYSSVPRPASVVPITTMIRYNEPIYPVRLSNDHYITKMLGPVRSVGRDIVNMSWYPEPAKKFTGRGHLACLHYVGDSSFGKRRPLCKDPSVRDDINLLSYYAKNRLAALGLGAETATAAPEVKEQPALVECS